MSDDIDVQTKRGCSCSLQSIFLLVAMTALTIILVNECKRSEIRLKQDQEAAKKIDGVLDKVSADTVKIKSFKQK